MNYAGFIPRYIAAIIDAVILLVASLILWVVPFLGGLLIFFLAPAYYTYYEGKEGATLGKKMMKLVVVDSSGGTIGYSKAFIRYIGRIISIIFLFIGFLWILIDEKKQGWHDKLAESYVISTEG